MKIITWNVNGLRSVLSKGVDGKKNATATNENTLMALIAQEDPDVLALQETRCPAKLSENAHIVPESYVYRNILESSAKKGYSGVAIFSKTVPIRVMPSTDFPENLEGRVMCVEFPKFYLINAYVPNSKQGLVRLGYRVETWEPAIRAYINKLQHVNCNKKPVVYTGDFNVAPTELDIYNASGKNKVHGFTLEERGAFATLLSECNMKDAYRTLYPTKREYSWFDARSKARERNTGWLIDRFVVSEALMKHVDNVRVLTSVMGSDHVPVVAEISV